MKRQLATLEPEAVPNGTSKMAADGWKAFAARRKMEPGWRYISPFRNRARMEEEAKKMKGTK